MQTAVENPMVMGAQDAWDEMHADAVVCVCKDCGCCICSGETYYEMDNGEVCESCAGSRRKTA